jgi:hypothetical protein
LLDPVGDVDPCTNKSKTLRKLRGPDMGFYSEDDLIKRLNAMESQIPGNVFTRLIGLSSHLKILNEIMRILEADEEPKERCLELARDMFERLRGRLVEDLVAARAGFEDIRVQLEKAGYEKEASQARDSIEKIDAACAARRVSPELLEEFDGLYGVLLSSVCFRGAGPM